MTANKVLYLCGYWVTGAMVLAFVVYWMIQKIPFLEILTFGTPLPIVFMVLSKLKYLIPIAILLGMMYMCEKD